ncbi:MAG: AEC family transporter [Clostridia bacterium]|nr:AEC family transporter [Clostridia bacterium]
MQNFLISFNVVFPIFLLMALGFLLRQGKLLSEPTVKQMNQLVFKVVLPASVFKNVYDSEIKDVFDGSLLAFSVVCVLAVILLALAVVVLFEKDSAKRGVLVQGIFRSNFVIFGLAVTAALCDGAVSGAASLLVAVVVPIFNFAAVIVLEAFGSRKADFKKILRGIVTNPLIIASVLGILVSACGLRFPAVIDKAIRQVASITTPLALIVLGASIHFSTVRSNAKQLVFGILARLVVVPAVCLSLAAFVFGFRGEHFAILLALFASPAAVSSFTMAQQMGGDGELAGQLVMFGTAASVATMFGFIYAAVSLGIL